MSIFYRIVFIKAIFTCENWFEYWREWYPKFVGENENIENDTLKCKIHSKTPPTTKVKSSLSSNIHLVLFHSPFGSVRLALYSFILFKTSYFFFPFTFFLSFFSLYSCKNFFVAQKQQPKQINRRKQGKFVSILSPENWQNLTFVWPTHKIKRLFRSSDMRIMCMPL